MEREEALAPALAARPHVLRPDNEDSAGCGTNETSDVPAGIAHTWSAPTPSPRHGIARLHEALSVEMVSSREAPDTHLEPYGRSRPDPPRSEATSEIVILRGGGGGVAAQRLPSNGSDVKLRGQGPRAYGRAARRLPACESRDAGGVTPCVLRCRRRLGRRTEAGPCQLLPRVRPHEATAAPQWAKLMTYLVVAECSFACVTLQKSHHLALLFSNLGSSFL